MKSWSGWDNLIYEAISLMKTRTFFCVVAIAMVLVGCTKPDFGENHYIDESSNVKFITPSVEFEKTGIKTFVCVHGVSGCGVSFNKNNGVFDILNVFWAPDDEYFYNGITTYIYIEILSEGTAQCRLYNDNCQFDTVVTITVRERVIPNDTNNSLYTFYPENRDFPIAQEWATIGVKGPKQMGMKIMDQFVLSSSANGHNSVGSDCDSWIALRFKYVGTAFVKFYNEDFDTLIQVNVLPTYTTYEEPPLDFDDTRDSVIAKMGIPGLEDETDRHLEYQLQGQTYVYIVRVFLLPSGLIKDYEVMVSGEEAKAELKSFVEERYKEIQTWNGYYVYARAFDTSYPDIYDRGTTVLVENFLQGKVVYKNPENHSNW